MSGALSSKTYYLERKLLVFILNKEQPIQKEMEEGLDLGKFFQFWLSYRSIAQWPRAKELPVP